MEGATCRRSVAEVRQRNLPSASHLRRQCRACCHRIHRTQRRTLPHDSQRRISPVRNAGTLSAGRTCHFSKQVTDDRPHRHPFGKRPCGSSSLIEQIVVVSHRCHRSSDSTFLPFARMPKSGKSVVPDVNLHRVLDRTRTGHDGENVDRQPWVE